MKFLVLINKSQVVTKSWNTPIPPVDVMNSTISDEWDTIIRYDSEKDENEYVKVNGVLYVGQE